jgi:hypothetical protein
MAAPGGAKADGSWRRAAGSRDAPDEEKQTKTKRNDETKGRSITVTNKRKRMRSFMRHMRHEQCQGRER